MDKGHTQFCPDLADVPCLSIGFFTRRASQRSALEGDQVVQGSLLDHTGPYQVLLFVAFLCLPHDAPFRHKRRLVTNRPATSNPARNPQPVNSISFRWVNKSRMSQVETNSFRITCILIHLLQPPLAYRRADPGQDEDYPGAFQQIDGIQESQAGGAQSKNRDEKKAHRRPSQFLALYQSVSGGRDQRSPRHGQEEQQAGKLYTPNFALACRKASTLSLPTIPTNCPFSTTGS